MTDDVVQRARQALDGITPGKWWWTGEIRNRLVADGRPDDLTRAREIIRCAALLHLGKPDADFITAAPQLVADLAAEVEQLRVWKREALTVTAGLQDLGKALGVPLGHRITGLVATKLAQELVAERDLLRATIARVRELAEEMAAAVPGEDPITDGCLPADVEQSNGQAILRALDGEAQ